MKSSIALLFMALAFAPALASAAGTKWALIVAGSNGYYNYRHQADACHAYQIFHKQGFPDSNIVVMMYDDIANSESNPVKGNIINKPDGENVYTGVPKDYTGADVTPDNFLKVLKGDKAGMKGVGSGKVIESGPDDEVFVAFFDHGAPGLIAFPSSYLYAKDMLPVLTDMHKNNQYKQMTLYIEACESGSMFENLLPTDINIYATTAANAHESSYATYYDSKRQTYLGDLYSVNWMENTDAADLSTETFEVQFEKVKAATNMSHVMQYGDLSMDKQTLNSFMSFKSSARSFFRTPTPAVDMTAANEDAIDSRDVKLATLQRNYLHATGARKAEIEVELRHEVARRELFDATFTHLATFVAGAERAPELLHGKSPLRDHDCLKASVQAFESSCMKFEDYSLKYIKSLRNMCEAGLSQADLATALSHVCA